MKTTFFRLFLGFFIINAFFSCQKNNDAGKADFDRKAMLENFANNLIIPAYTDLQGKISVLQAATNQFTQNPDQNKLLVLQNAWEETYVAWQFANAYNFGVAAEEGLKNSLINEIGTFPVNETKINANIANNNTNLTDPNRDARGFLAAEYLIFDQKNNQNTILNNFSDAKRKSYLLALVNHLKSKTDEIILAWNGYKSSFVANAGTDVGSSTSQFYNEFVKSYESIKNYKVALPLGKSLGQTQALPNRVEAFYSGKSLKMINEHLTAIENIWYGKAKNGQEGIGFKKYLESVEGGNALILSTQSQFLAVKNAFAKIPQNVSLSQQITESPKNIENFYVELQKLNRFLKSDLSSLLGIAITYSSGDGD
ncbi:MAG: hypothetical protein EAZ97_06595 [Bacteroidetes bacterium]|nr:MAG: hypothetical protein EAZ97_06595 [Bacteroidota bacterium]